MLHFSKNGAYRNKDLRKINTEIGQCILLVPKSKSQSEDIFPKRPLHLPFSILSDQNEKQNNNSIWGCQQL